MPKLGDVVLYRLDRGRGEGQQVPAIVTNVLVEGGVAGVGAVLDLTVLISPAVHDPDYELRGGAPLVYRYAVSEGEGIDAWQLKEAGL